jgi:hypothetical protein
VDPTSRKVKGLSERIQDHLMTSYRVAGQEFFFPYEVHELAPFEVIGKIPAAMQSLPVPLTTVLSCRATGWVGGAQRKVESWSAPPGILLKVAGGSDFYLTPGGRDIVRSIASQEDVEHGDHAQPYSMTQLDREILVGPALVLALALRGTWCLHASAVILKDHLIVFLGESMEGKSTLAAFLSGSGDLEGRLVADDILPVTVDAAGVQVWSHFPQLKLPIIEQPGIGLPEQLPLDGICVLKQTDRGNKPELHRLAPGRAAQRLVRHTAGARLFDPALLAKHLVFCGQVAGQVPVHQLVYPHNRDALTEVKGLLEELC